MTRQALLSLYMTAALVAAASADDASPLFRQTIRVGDTLYLSGQGSRDPENGKHPEGMGAATRQAMLNLKRGLDAEGFSFSDVVTSHVWLTDLGKYKEMNAAYRSFFKESFPTRTTVGVSGLPGGSTVEIAMVAVTGPKQVIYPRGSERGNLPFSPGILVDDTLYVSGQAGIDPKTGKLVEGGFADHVSQTLKNIGAVLDAAQMDFSNVVSTYVFIQDVDNFGALNPVYKSFTKQPRPARLPVGVASLPLNSPVEITMIASRKDRQPILGKDQLASENYSRGLLSNGRMHLAGVFARDGTMKEQVEKLVRWNESILKAGNMNLSNVLEVRVYLADGDDFEAMNQAYREHFPTNPPTRATIFVPRLPAKSKIMMGFVAAK
jgi:reactive intermediate/imine deaminase